MSDADPVFRPVQQVVTAAFVDCWRELLDADGLTPEGLALVRARLQNEPQWLLPGPRVDLLRLDIDRQLARELDCEPSELPDSPIAADYPDQLPPPDPDPGHRPW
jgi:hypothetical protein